MIKYFPELNRPNNVALSLTVSLFDSNFNIETIPPDFLNKYSVLISRLNSIDLFIRSFNVVREQLYLLGKNYYDQTGNFNTPLFVDDHTVLMSLTNNKQNIPDIHILENREELSYLLSYYLKALSEIFYFHPEYKCKWRFEWDLLTEALNDIYKYGEFIIKRQDSKAEDVILPNNWYITSYGDLYNGEGPGGHKETTLFNPYEQIKCFIGDERSLETEAKYLLDEMYLTKKRGYVDHDQFQHYLNYYPQPAYIVTQNDEPGFSRIYEQQIYKAVLGVISAETSLYGFFSYMQKNVKDPKKELYRIRELTNGAFADVLVRCAGFHKIETVLPRVITTTLIDPFSELEEYVKKGWDVHVIKPLVVNKQKGVVEVLDTESLIAQRLIEKNMKKYELRRKTEAGYGKIKMFL